MISWFARNHIAANLLMLFILLAGALTLPSIRKEFIPAFSLEQVHISIPYPGATPIEVEEAICLRVEEAIANLDGIKLLKADAFEGAASISAEIDPAYDVDSVLDDIRTRVDAIDSFPPDVERPIISKPSIRSPVIQLAVAGPYSRHELRRLAETVRNDLSQRPELSQVELSAVKSYEIAIEIDEARLQAHNLRLEDISQAINSSSVDLPAGRIKTRAGEMTIRSTGQAYSAEEFETIPILTNNNGHVLTLGDIANVSDTFNDSDLDFRINDLPAIKLLVYRVGNQDILSIADSVRAYSAESHSHIPKDIHLHAFQDESELFRGRLQTLTDVALSGLILVFAVLALFLRWKLAFWVSLGIAISFMGTLLTMFVLGASLNMISLFAFILVIGIVVDDAIVVGESVALHQERDKLHGLKAGIIGTQHVARPVFFAVITSIVAFVPMLFLPGVDGKFWGVIPVVVIAALAFSLVESLLILPAHLSHESILARTTRVLFGWSHILFWPFQKSFDFIQRGFITGLDLFIEKVYQPILRASFAWRYFTVASFIGVLIIFGGLLFGDRIKTVFFPKINADYITANIDMPIGTPVSETTAAVEYVRQKVEDLKNQLNEESPNINVFSGYLITIGQKSIGGSRRSSSTSNSGNSHEAQIIIEMYPSEEHNMDSGQLSDRLSKMVGSYPGAKSISIFSQFTGRRPDISVLINGNSLEAMSYGTQAIRNYLDTFDGIYDVSDTFPDGKDELKVQINRRGLELGMRQRDLARQIRSAIFGDEVQRVQRGRDDVAIMLRLPESQRRSLSHIYELPVSLPNSGIVPLHHVADISLGVGLSTIRREDRRRIIEASARANRDIINNPDEIRQKLQAHFEEHVQKRFPELHLQDGGSQRDRGDLTNSLAQGFGMAVLVIYSLLAIAFRSYIQPFIVIIAIPFGLIGSLGGHVIMGQPVSMLSFLGMVALAGVVVNDSLVLVDGMNNYRKKGHNIKEAVRLAGSERFRPILLTTLTTFFGLLPLMFETSVQTQFLIPMAISLSFGVLFATVITLVLVPALCGIVQDVLDLCINLGKQLEPANRRVKPNDSSTE